VMCSIIGPNPNGSRRSGIAQNILYDNFARLSEGVCFEYPLGDPLA